MSQKFPEVIYVKQEEDGDSSFLVADDDFAGLAEMGEAVPVAVYRLESTGILVTESSTQVNLTAAPKPTKKRAGNKATEAVAVAQTAVEAVAKEATTVAETATQAVKHTVEHVQAALESVFSKHGLATARGLLSRFGVQRAKDLKPEQYTAFVTDAGKVVETGKV